MTTIKTRRELLGPAIPISEIRFRNTCWSLQPESDYSDQEQAESITFYPDVRLICVVAKKSRWRDRLTFYVPESKVEHMFLAPELER